MKRTLIHIIISTALVILLNCTTTKWSKNNGWSRYTFDNLPTQSDFPNAGAIILLDQGDLEINNSEGFAYSTLERRRVVKILNKKGYKYANVTIPYSSSTSISDINARTITPSGQIVPLEANKIFDVTMYPGFVFYSDIKAKKFTLPGVEPGCIVEYKWKKTVPNFTYWDQWTFQNDEPTLISRYKVLAPSEWDLKSRPRHINIEPQTENLPAGFKQTYLWEAKNIEPFEFEPMMPPISRSIKSVLFSPIGMDSWQKVEDWYISLLGNRIHSTKNIQSFTERLVADCKTPKQKLEKIYKFVRDNIRYISISIGVGGYQPHYAEEVLTNRYGDCKDKATLLSAMAQSQGINVDIALISTAQNGLVDTTIASHVQFNHVISKATIGKSTIWMDATEEFCPFGKLPWYDSNRLLFVVNANENQIWYQTPNVNISDNMTEKKWRLIFNNSQLDSGTFSAVYSGAPALQMRKYFGDFKPNKIKEQLGKKVYVQFPSSIIDSICVKNYAIVDSSFSYLINFKTDTTKFIFNSLSLSTFFTPPFSAVFTNRERKFPIVLSFPIIEKDRIEIILNEKTKLKGIPNSISFSNEYFCYSTVIERSLEGIIIDRYLEIKAVLIEPQYYDYFKKCLKHIAMSDSQNFLFWETAK